MWLGVRVLFAVVQRALFRCSRTFSLRVRAVTLNVSEFLAVVAPHLSWFPCGYHRSSSTGNLVGVARYRQSVDVKVSHHRLDVVDAEVWAVDARRFYKLVGVSGSL